MKSKVAKDIVELLKKKGKFSTYQIAKELNANWETVNRHLHMLALDGVVRKIKEPRGYQERVMWELAEVEEDENDTPRCDG